MPSFVYSPGAAGNIFNDIILPPNTTVAAFIDASEYIEPQFTFEALTGSTPPGTLPVFSLYKVYGNQSQNTVAASSAIGATSLSLASIAGIQAGQQFCVQQATGALSGEIVTVSGAITGTGPYSVPVSGAGTYGGTLYPYSLGDKIYLIPSSPMVSRTPFVASGSLAANSLNSFSMRSGPSQFVVTAFNPNTFVGYTLSIISWGDGATVPTTGVSTVIVGIDNSGLLRIRVFDPSGKQTDVSEANLPSSDAPLIASLKALIPSLLPPNTPTASQQSQILNEVNAIVNLTPIGIWVTCDGITNLQ